MTIALLLVAVVASIPIWLRLVIAAVALMQVGLAYAWRGVRRRMDSAYPDA